MDTFDAMGPRPDRRAAFTGRLLAHEEDAELDAIVAEAARVLDVPVAMINLVLDHVQRFRAAHGLDAELEAAGATDREMSFCQIVASEGRPLEVTDAEQDPRVPQFLVRTKGIRAYLGVPIVANDVVVGALCVLCDQPRRFSEAERVSLLALSERVNTRLAELAEAPDPTTLLRERSTVPTLSRIRSTLVPIANSARAGLLALEGLHPVLKLVQRQSEVGSVDAELLTHAVATARRALRSCDDAFCEVEASVGDAALALQALEQLFVADDRPRLVPIALAGRELSREATAPVGGVFVPDTANPQVHTPQPLAVALVDTALTRLAAELAGTSQGIRMDVVVGGPEAALRFSGPDVTGAVAERVASVLEPHVAALPRVRVSFDAEALWLHFAQTS